MTHYNNNCKKCEYVISREFALEPPFYSHAGCMCECHNENPMKDYEFPSIKNMKEWIKELPDNLRVTWPGADIEFYADKHTECHICGISSFSHRHKKGMNPKDYEIIPVKQRKNPFHNGLPLCLKCNEYACQCPVNVPEAARAAYTCLHEFKVYDPLNKEDISVYCFKCGTTVNGMKIIPPVAYSKGFDCGPTCLIHKCAPCPCGADRPTALDWESQFQKAWNHVKGFCNALEDLDGQEYMKALIKSLLSQKTEEVRNKIVKMKWDEDCPGNKVANCEFHQGYNQADAHILERLNKI